MGAIAAHKVPERMADGTCTQGWVWMTNKCRKRMNRKEEYITTEISQEKGGGEEEEGGPKTGRRLLRDREGLAHSRPRARGPFSLGRWAARFCVPFIPKTSRHLIKAQLLAPLSTNSL